MKVLLIIASVLLVAAVAAKPKRCKTSDDCEENECCVKFLSFFTGRCKPLASEGEVCSMEGPDIDGRHLLRCPCQTGLSCEPEEIIKEKEITIHRNIRCVKEGDLTTEVEKESTAEE